MAKPGETLLLVGVLGGVAYLLRDKLKTLFTSAKAGQSTAGTHAPGAPTSNPTGPAALDALSKIAQGILKPVQWGVAQPTFTPGITYQNGFGQPSPIFTDEFGNFVTINSTGGTTALPDPNGIGGGFVT